ncbi:Cy124 [Cynomolgus cytomegalovirus]|uniref:Rh124 n=4 Tax=Cytomegalovirus TaxID=10358 RepID=Q2FAI8_RHCM6|nr:Cy124 [Cynomolgus cytomegalovirus]AAZ80628.1 rhUL89 [macacine betaherpesvirus 3]QMS44013.1 Rh124 [synthetic construct]QQL10414.1 Rh124 [macacine betaherpesvirus 3]QQL10593.1 Rh124 [Rhesus cytomegalovirus strain 68-1.2]QQL10775.1 Rh124 [Rhesus cytomegalovirus strain 68-1_FL]
MLRGESASRIQERYQELLKRKNHPSSCISTSFTNVAALCRKRYQMMHPELGLAHCCNEAFLPLMTFCGRYRDYHSEEDRRTLLFHENLKTALDNLNFLPCPEDQRQSYQKLDALTELYRDPQFVQINNFMTDFKRWLDGGFATMEGDAKPIRLEPFQKNLLIHVIFFIAVTKIPVLANRVLQYLVHAFEIDFLSQTSVEVFKQKATVFLVPRRHGKTWFIIPIICFLLKHMIGISIGYVAHQKHVSQFVLKEVEFRCRHTFAKDYVVENKDFVISIDHKGAKSTALFASCYNTNSIRGQNFHLLLVDEAHFIKKEAFNTILGFLAQNTTKIIFISSTNTTSDATCFLTRLNNAPFDMLNVVSYVCEEHLHTFTEKGDATACPCYRLHKPTFISLNSQVRKTANMFMPGSFMDEIIGGTNKITESNVLITDQSRDEFDILRYSTLNVNAQEHFGKTIYVYLDPAFTTNRKASGTGIAAVGLYRHQFIIYGLEHYFLRDLSESSETAIAECAAHMLTSVINLHPYINELRIAVEGNSNQAAAVRIACLIRQNVQCNSLIPVLFYHTPDQNNIEQPFYLMGRDKRLAVEQFISRFNSGYIKASQEIVSYTIKLNHDPIEYLLEQIQNLHRITLAEGNTTYSAKRHHKYSDDLVVAVIMATYLCDDIYTARFKAS